MAFDKDIPTSGTSLRASNPQILENQESTQEAVNNEHIFAGTAAGTQTGDHTQGSARCFFAATAPALRIDGNNFIVTDNGSLWIDTDDNALSIMTDYSQGVAADKWTLVSAEVIATLLGSARTFLDALTVTGLTTINDQLFVNSGTTDIVAAFASSDTNAVIQLSDDSTAGGSEAALHRQGDILFLNPTTGDTRIGTATGLDDRSVADKAYVDVTVSIDADGVLMHDSEGAFNNCDITDNDAGPTTTKTKVYTKYIIGTTDPSATTSVAHGITGGDAKILACIAVIENTSSAYFVSELFEATDANNSYSVQYNATNVIFSGVGTNFQSQLFRVKLDYTL